MKDEFQSLGNIIKKYFKAKGFDIKIAEAKIKQNIHKIIPPKISSEILEMFITNRKLYIKINTPIAKQELLYHKENLRKEIQKIAENAIDDIIIF